MAQIHSSSRQIRVFIVDDHPLICQSVEGMLATRPEMVYGGSAASCGEALEKIKQVLPDVVLLDLGLTHSNGFELLRRMRHLLPQTGVLVFSMHDEEKFALRAIREGARGYMMKTAKPQEVLKAIADVAAGQLVIGPAIQQRLLQEASGEEPLAPTPDRILSSREWEIFELLGKGLTMKEVSRRLRISEKTVGSFCDRIKLKLNKPRLRDVARTAQQWLCDDPF
ncbi:MAG: response regulator transcription factor [Kiritimatiellae bacterium]|nr:response regulator transcription factor [Kiritimatiellia bacterium]